MPYCFKIILLSEHHMRYMIEPRHRNRFFLSRISLNGAFIIMFQLNSKNHMLSPFEQMSDTFIHATIVNSHINLSSRSQVSMLFQITNLNIVFFRPIDVEICNVQTQYGNSMAMSWCLFSSIKSTQHGYWYTCWSVELVSWKKMTHHCSAYRSSVEYCD